MIAQTHTARLDSGEVIATGAFNEVDTAAMRVVLGPDMRAPEGYMTSTYVNRGVRSTVFDPSGKKMYSYFICWQAEDTGALHGPIATDPTPEPPAEIIEEGPYVALNAAAGFTQANPDAMVIDPRPEKPTATEGMFQRGYNYQHATVIRWEWSNTFGKWGASVKFDDGSSWYTWPATDYAALPPIGGGAHTAAELSPTRLTLAAVQASCVELSAMYGQDIKVFRCLTDGTPKSDGSFYRITVDGLPMCAPVRRLTTVCNRLHIHMAQCAAHPSGIVNPHTPLDMDMLANMPQVTACDLPKPTTRATSQKRDNERAERNAHTEAYHMNATNQVQEISDVIASFGFTMLEQHDRSGTPVTIWAYGNAYIKQTPFTIRIYDHLPVSRVGRKPNAKLVNRVDHGWCQDGETTGYAAGIVAALLPLLETPDPLMQALDAQEARYPEGDYRNDYPEDDNLMPPVQTCQKCGNKLTLSGICDRCDMPALILNGGQPAMTGPWQEIEIVNSSYTVTDDAGNPIEFGSYALLPTISGGSHPLSMEDDASSGTEEDISGTPGYAPDFANVNECAAHYGFDKPRPRVELCDECRVNVAVEQGLCRHCFDTHPGYCLKACGRLVTVHVPIGGGMTGGYCDECASCQHDADEPADRYALVDSSPLDAGNALIAEANRAIKNAYTCVIRQQMSIEARNRIVNDANATLSAARHLTLVCTDQRTRIDAEEMDRIMEELRILHHVGLMPPAGLHRRMSELSIFTAWYQFRHMLGHDKAAYTVTFNNDANDTFTAHQIMVARKIAQNATACGLTDCATIHETRKGKSSIFRERWQDGQRLSA